MPHIFISGGNRGIGLALVTRFLDAGWNVYTTYRDADTAQELLQLSDSLNTNQFITKQLDITDYQAVAEFAKQIPQLDVLVHNAGVYGSRPVLFGQVNEEEWRHVLEVNTIAPLKVSEIFKSALDKGQLKCIAFISSKVGSMADNQSGGSYVYRSSKAAINSVMKSLSIDLLDENYTVASLHPGWVKTEMGGANALLTVEESSHALFQRIIELPQTKTGLFLNYNGDEIPW